MRSLQQYNSGNCIVFAESVKLYLKKNFNIKSYIIGASVPSIFKVPGTPHICHCAVVIPISLYEFYILDCALYFLTPMYCSLKDNKVREIYNSNCHNHEKTKIFTFRGCPPMEIFYMIPTMLLCPKKCFSTKKSDGQVSRLVHKGPPFAISPRWNRLRE